MGNWSSVVSLGMFRGLGLRIAVGTFAVLLAAFSLAQTWKGVGGGNWSLGSNWIGGTPPPAGGSDTTVLTFLDIGAGGWTATNDLGTFHLNQLDLNSQSTGLTTIASAAGSSLWFGGSNPMLNLLGVGDFTISSNITLGSDLTIGGSGVGATTLSGVISGSGGLTFSGIGSAVGVTVSGLNTYTGNTTLDAGSVVTTGQDGSFGAGTIVANGGSLSSRGGLSNNIQLNGTLTLAGGNFLGSISGSGSLAGTGNIGGLATYTGATIADGLSIGGNGQILDTSSITLSGGLETFTNGGINIQAGGSGSFRQRLGASIPIHMINSSFYIQSADNNPEIVGAIDGQYMNLLVNFYSGTATGVLNAASLTRNQGGFYWFQGQNLGQAGPGSAQILLNTGPSGMVGGGGAAGSTTISIVPYAASGITASNISQNFDSLVTYGPNGFRPLNPTTEYATAFGNPLANVSVGGIDNEANVTVNSLLLGNFGITGAGTINVTSGAILAPGTNADPVQNRLNFGSAEGFVIVGNSNVTLSGGLSGTGGVTFVGYFGSANLTSDNSALTGQLTVDDANVSYAAMADLPGTGDIYMGGGQLNYTGTTGGTLSRNFHIEGSPTISGSLTLNSQISGAGNPYFYGGTLPIIINGINTYTGNTKIGGGVEISSDQNLGLGSEVILNGSATAGLTLLGDWTTNRMILGQTATMLNTNGFQATWNGSFGIFNAGVVKTGAGDLTINANMPGSASWASTINGGSITANGVMPSMGFTVASATGTSGTLKGKGTVGNVTLGAHGQIAPGTTGVGTLAMNSLTWNGGGAIDFDLGASSDLISVLGAFTKGSTSGGSTFAFNFADAGGTTPGFYTLATFGSQTGFSVGNFSFSGFTGLQGHFVLNSTNLQFDVTSAPEPGVWVGLGLGLLALRLRRRRAMAS